MSDRLFPRGLLERQDWLIRSYPGALPTFSEAVLRLPGKECRSLAASPPNVGRARGKGDGWPRVDALSCLEEIALQPKGYHELH